MTVPTDDWFDGIKQDKNGKDVFPPVARPAGRGPKNLAEAMMMRLLPPEIVAKSVTKGGSGSGNFGHSGRPGEVGGSGAGNMLTSAPSKPKLKPTASEAELLDRFKPDEKTAADRLKAMSQGHIGSGPEVGGADVYKSEHGAIIRFETDPQEGPMGGLF